MARQIRINLAVGALVWLSLLSLLLLGCGPEKSEFKPLANGFGLVIIPGGIDRSPGAELHYRGPDGKDTLIWDNLSSQVMITNDMAYFSGERLAAGGERLESRLFAVRAPGPAIDITVQVHQIAEKAAGRELVIRPIDESFVGLERRGDKMVAIYVSNDPQTPSLYVIPTWDQISNLLSSAVQGTGK